MTVPAREPSEWDEDPAWSRPAASFGPGMTLDVLRGPGGSRPLLARDLATAAARNPKTTWCVTVTDQYGHAIMWPREDAPCRS